MITVTTFDGQQHEIEYHGIELSVDRQFVTLTYMHPDGRSCRVTFPMSIYVATQQANKLFMERHIDG